MSALNGSYQHTMDAKGRVALPAVFRKALPDKVTLVIGNHDAVYVFADDEFERWLSTLFGEVGYDPQNEVHGLIDLQVRAGARPTSIDSAGRVNVAADLRQKAGLTKNVTVIGRGDHLEMWDTERFEEFMSQIPSLDELLYSKSPR